MLVKGWMLLVLNGKPPLRANFSELMPIKSAYCALIGPVFLQIPSIILDARWIEPPAGIR